MPFQSTSTLSLLVVVGVGLLQLGATQHEDIPYENVKEICETCMCWATRDASNHTHHSLSCNTKGFKHILARWPQQFRPHRRDDMIVASFSGNTIEILQQLPPTNATLSFICRHCGIKHLQAPTFMDVPNIRSLDLAWNEITSDELTPDVFRGPYHTTQYEPIALVELDLSHNKLHSLDRHIFEHTPNLTKLYLSYNPFNVLNNPTTTALASVALLKILDLSNTGLATISGEIFENLIALETLNLGGNQFTTVPDNLHLLGHSLRVLNLAGNGIERFSEQSLVGLKVLTRLNISDMPVLRAVENGTFSRLETLRYLHCSHNPHLETFDLDSLMHCPNLTHLDISHCHLTTLFLNMDLSVVSESNRTSITLPRPWPRLKTFETIGNPWLCDCQLLQTLEYAGAHHRDAGSETRCEAPYVLAGARLSNLTATQICAMQIPKRYRVIDEDPPRFRRKRYIVLTLITASVVVVLGLVIGFAVVCLRRRLKRSEFGVEPIRYTSVRSSNLSAFSQINANGSNNVA